MVQVTNGRAMPFFGLFLVLGFGLSTILVSCAGLEHFPTQQKVQKNKAAQKFYVSHQFKIALTGC